MNRSCNRSVTTESTLQVGSLEMIFSIKSKYVGCLSSKLLLTALTVCFIYEGYENFSLKRSLETEKLEKRNLEARNYLDENKKNKKPDSGNLALPG